MSANDHGDELQINMESISKELNDLVITYGKDVAMTQQLYRFNENLPVKVNPTQQHMVKPKPRYVLSSQNQLHAPANVNFSNTNHNLNAMRSHVSSPQNVNTFANAKYPPVYTGVGFACGSNTMQSNRGLSYMASQSNQFMTPHARTNGKAISAPLLSRTANDEAGSGYCNGAYKKYYKSNSKSNFKPQCDDDYDNIAVDISILGLSKDCKNSNPVLRLFAQFIRLHNAIAECLPSHETKIDCGFASAFAPSPIVILPQTMSVQQQVKYAYSVAIIFHSSLLSLVNANMKYEPQLAADCECNLFNLRQLLTQLEMYKYYDLEHKRGQFIREDIRVHAERLEMLLEEINHQIRETHLRAVVFDWYVGIKYCGQSLKKNDNSMPVQRSEIGTVNEILQLSSQLASYEENKLPNGNKLQEELLMPKNYEDVQIKCPINNTINNNIDAAAAEAAAEFDMAIAAAATINTHVRQPVFYIG